LIVPFVTLILIWGFVSELKLFPSYLFPSPLQVAESFYRETFENKTLLTNLGDSLIRVLLGYVPGIAGGLVVGLLMGLDERVARFFSGPISFFNAIPALAWVPIAILWFGIGYGSVTFIIFLSVFFPVVVNTLSGIRSIPGQYINVAK